MKKILFIAIGIFVAQLTVVQATVNNNDNKIDRTRFFTNCQNHKQFKSLASGNKKKTIELFFDYYEKKGHTDKRWIAYILATVYRETWSTMQPIREGNCSTNEAAIEAVRKLVAKRNEKRVKEGKIPMIDYSFPDETGNSFYGRGFVQITGKNNYWEVGKKLGLDSMLIKNPDKTLETDISLKIAFEGMVHGWFTRNKKTKLRNKLSVFFNSTTEDWISARDIINPGTTLEHKKITAEIGKTLYSFLID